jgi:hypothetical protein
MAVPQEVVDKIEAGYKKLQVGMKQNAKLFYK